MTTTATVTLLFTDVVGSTEWLVRLGEETYEQARRAHFRYLREAVTANGGQEVKTIGDGLMAVFGSAFNAVSCAVDMQRAVARHNRMEPDLQLLVRVGLNVGEPIQDEGDYFGAPVVIARRLCDSADGGQIIASDLVKWLVGARGGIEFKSLGPRDLKGFSEPVVAWEIAWEAPADEAAAAPTAAVGRGPLVGRRRELAEAASAVEEARQGRGGVVLVVGEPGIGKTRLAREITTQQAADFRVFQAGAIDSEGMPPYFLFSEALRPFVRRCPPAELREHVRTSAHLLARIIPDLTRVLPDLGEAREPYGTEREDLLSAVVDFILSIAEKTPVLMVLDDLQWADSSSLSLFEYLAQRIQSAPVLLLALCRPEAVEVPHRFARSIGELGRQRLYRAISLSPLSVQESAALISGIVGGEPAEEIAAAIHRRTAGNPFFVEEVVAKLSEDGVDLLQTGTVSGISIPRSVRLVIERRLVRLGDEARELLGVASVLGERFTFPELAAVAETSREAIVEALDRSLASGILREAEGAYEFNHPLVRETVYTANSTPRRQSLHLRAARALEALYTANQREQACLLAYHFREAGPLTDSASLLRHSLTAADTAIQTYAYADAASLYKDVLDLDASAGALSEPERADAHCSYGRALQAEGSQPEALRQYGLAAALYEQASDFLSVARAQLYQAGVHLFQWQLSEAERFLHEAHETLAEHGLLESEDGKRLEASILHQAAQNHLLLRRYPRAEAMAEEVLRIAQELKDNRLTSLGYSARGYVYLHWLRPVEALDDNRALQRTADSVGDAHRSIYAATRGVTALIAMGRLQEAAEWIAQVESLHERMQSPRYKAFDLTNRALLAFLQGDLASAEKRATGALALPDLDPWTPLTLVPLLAQIKCYEGDFDGAGRWAERMLNADERAGRPARPVQGWGYKALIAGLAGDREACRRMSEETISGLLPRRPDLRALAIDVPAAEIAVLLRDKPLAERQLQPLHELREAGVAITPAWPVLLPRLLGGLSGVLERWQEAEQSLNEAIELAEKIDARPELGRSYLDLARMRIERHHRGDLVEAGVLLAKAAEVFKQANVTYFLDQALSVSATLRRRPVPSVKPKNPAGLTDREMEVLRLLARGKSNREIADELVLSLNTVIRHVSSILMKTGAANRTQAAAFASREDLA
jgi:predicted ATPase/class 3 adenylate cyclase/DNA-binding CsgD family transcriptional regulator